MLADLCGCQISPGPALPESLEKANPPTPATPLWCVVRRSARPKLCASMVADDLGGRNSTNERPYAGDVTGGAVGTYIISRALKYNLPKRLVMRMLINQAIDSCVGVIPFVGDLFDFGFKANTRNMKLLQKHLERPKSAKRADTCFLFSLFILVVVVPMLLVVAIIGAIVLGILAALGKLR